MCRAASGRGLRSASSATTVPDVHLGDFGDDVADLLARMRCQPAGDALCGGVALALESITRRRGHLECASHALPRPGVESGGPAWKSRRLSIVRLLGSVRRSVRASSRGRKTTVRPSDRDTAIRLTRSTVDLGADRIDSVQYYGPAEVRRAERHLFFPRSRSGGEVPAGGGQPGRQVERVGHECPSGVEVGLVRRRLGEPAEHLRRVAEGGDGLER